MKKCTFYTMHQIGGGTEAKLHTGYTDGKFNYYKAGSIWFAIDPQTGIAVCNNNTRASAGEIANGDKITKMLEEYRQKEEYGKLVEQFNEAVIEAENKAKEVE